MDDDRGEKEEVDRTSDRNNTWITTRIEEKPEGKPGGRTPRRSLLNQIMLDTEKESYRQLKRVTLDREEWRSISSFNRSTD